MKDDSFLPDLSGIVDGIKKAAGDILDGVDFEIKIKIKPKCENVKKEKRSRKNSKKKVPDGKSTSSLKPASSTRSDDPAQ